VPGVEGATAIALGEAHSCAIVAGGAVRCWGDNPFGQLGDGTKEDRASPAAVVGLGRARAITAGAAHTCAIDEAGTVSCWGSNRSGELGDGTLDDHASPKEVAW
jgi:alpha-tubulin suppressor-like RCC1 family protein